MAGADQAVMLGRPPGRAVTAMVGWLAGADQLVLRLAGADQAAPSAGP